MGRREGIYFWDLSGKRYINCHCNGGVFNMGHRNPDIAAALTSAVAQFDIGNHHLISGPRTELAARLAQSFAAGGRGLFSGRSLLTKIIFGSSGGESADLSIKIARGYTGRQKVVSLSGGYHGHTGLAVAAGDAKYRTPFGVELPGFVQIPVSDESALHAAVDTDTAAIILETVPATLGMPILSNDYMKSVARVAKKNGALLILDEIQTGLGRTGKMWGYQHYDVNPDMVLIGKGLSGGMYPMSAVAMRPDLERLFKKDPFIHISTFGGSEVGCFVSLKTLDLIQAPGFLDHVNELGEIFEREWKALARGFEEIIEIRRLGLFMGIVLDSPGTCLVTVKALLDKGIFAVYANNDKRVLQFLPPMITTRDQAREIMEIVRKALTAGRTVKYRLLKKALHFML
ncbi:MAG: aspartate aminotransferase family protein [Spirochaetia bacterium]|nr:aspartate aminotransferase family protein [Spirochaetia bacterium]